jgi:hypothetical protein
MATKTSRGVFASIIDRALSNNTTRIFLLTSFTSSPSSDSTMSASPLGRTGPHQPGRTTPGKVPFL